MAFTQRTRSKKQSKSLKTFVPHDYQKESIDFLLKKPFSGLFLAPGLGKTMCVLSAFDLLKKKKKVDKVLIVAKKKIIRNVWPKELKKWGVPYTTSILHASNRVGELRNDAAI